MKFRLSIRKRLVCIHMRVASSASVPLRRQSGISNRPLVLVVEPALDKRQALIQLFTALQCTVFVVEDHTQVMAWAPVLPFSAVVMNHFAADARCIVVKRLKYLVEENLMMDIPIWLMASSLTAEDERSWREAGIAMFLTHPLRHAKLAPLCETMLTPDARFYSACDTLLRSDFPPNVLQRMPELNREVAQQMRQLQGMLRESPTAHTGRTGEHAHALKSATLSLGYYRLAALASEIEHALADKTFGAMTQHWQIIAERLDPLVFEENSDDDRLTSPSIVFD